MNREMTGAELIAKYDEQLRALTDDKNQLIYIPVENIYPHKDNPRKELGDLSELTESIKANGVMQNLTVVPWDFANIDATKEEIKKHKDDFTAVIGHRRLSAARAAGLSEVPCVIIDMPYPQQLSTMLLENIQRSDLTPYEQAKGFQLMMDFGETVDSISEKTGFSKTTVRRRLEMAKLNEKTLKEVSARQLSLDDFDKLSKIKNMKKRNEVLGKIGTANFESALQIAIKEELIAERMPVFVKKAVELGAKLMKDEDRWSGKYERIADIDVKTAEEEDSLVPKKYQNEALFYSVREYYGSLEIYRKKPKEQAKKRPRAEIEREKAIEEMKKSLKAMTEMAKVLRGNFAREIVMHSKNRDLILSGAVAVLECGVTSYAYSVPSKTVLEFIGEKTSEDYKENRKAFHEVMHEKPGKAVPALIYLHFENGGNMRYYMERYDDFPTHVKNEYLDKLYEWLISLGYEMSDDERGLIDGTHPIFKDHVTDGKSE